MSCLEKKKSGKYGRLKNCAKKMWRLWEKSSPIRMTLNTVGVEVDRYTGRQYPHNQGLVREHVNTGSEDAAEL